MPTRHGWTLLVTALASALIGRVFGILELFVIAGALLTAIAVALAVVRLRTPAIGIERTLRPRLLTVGGPGRVELTLSNRGRLRSPQFRLTEPVGDSSSATITVDPVGRATAVHATYRVPTARRGVVKIGPTQVSRTDLLGLAQRTQQRLGTDWLAVAPSTFPVEIPSLGGGVLGRQLLAQAQRLGPGEFHSLRDYAPGDDLRTINWKASARSETLKVRQHETQGLQRCIVVLDTDAQTYQHHPVPDGQWGAATVDSFERAIVIAASIACTAEESGLATRFVAGSEIDLRGHEIAQEMLRLLAAVELTNAGTTVDRDPGDGLGLLIVVTATHQSQLWQRSAAMLEPTLARIGVFTELDNATGVNVPAQSLPLFRNRWQQLTGAGRQVTGAAV